MIGINQRGISLAVLLWLASSIGSAEGAIVRLRESAVAAGPVVTLGDIAEVLDGDEAAGGRLRSAVLTPSPPPERQLRLDFALIRTRLAALGFDLQQLEFTGSSACLVSSPAPARLTAEKSAPAARARTMLTPRKPTEFQRHKLAEDLSEVIVESVAARQPELGRVAVDLQLEPGQVLQLLQVNRPQFQVVASRAAFGERQLFEIHATDAGGQTEVVVIKGELRPVPRVVVLQYAVPKGHRIRAEDLAWAQLKESLQSPAIDRPEAAIGKETLRALRAGEPISPGDLQDTPLVRSGDIVTVYSRQRGISVRMEAKSRGAGALGEQIQLVTLDGREKLVARVTGFHEAEVTAAGVGNGP